MERRWTQINADKCVPQQARKRYIKEVDNILGILLQPFQPVLTVV